MLPAKAVQRGGPLRRKSLLTPDRPKCKRLPTVAARRRRRLRSLRRVSRQGRGSVEQRALLLAETPDPESCFRFSLALGSGHPSRRTTPDSPLARLSTNSVVTVSRPSVSEGCSRQGTCREHEPIRFCCHRGPLAKARSCSIRRTVLRFSNISSFRSDQDGPSRRATNAESTIQGRSSPSELCQDHSFSDPEEGLQAPPSQEFASEEG